SPKSKNDATGFDFTLPEESIIAMAATTTIAPRRQKPNEDLERMEARRERPVGAVRLSMNISRTLLNPGNSTPCVSAIIDDSASGKFSPILARRPRTRTGHLAKGRLGKAAIERAKFLTRQGVPSTVVKDHP
ncbi:MAG TPA: hypothetical protein VGP68_01250, partial [Gemmataceae bacterium]|nr:hypothetical protein [Gemmataceae bacterium]